MAGVLANATVVLHFAALLYIGLGGFLGWRWPKTIFVHVFFAIWGVLVNVFPLPCPLTSLENVFRHQQGLPDLPGGFNDYYILGVIFPDSFTPIIALGALLCVIVSYVGTVRLWRSRRTGQTTAEPKVRIAG